MLTTIIITRNEEQVIGDCLKSVDFSDEVIVVDSGNTDSTNRIARSLGARLVTSKGKDYSRFREDGLREAKGEWILYVDADERVPLGLKQEIITKITSPENASAYAIPRQNIYLGKPMNFGGWGNDYVIRLLKKSDHFGWYGALHEQPKFRGNLVKLTQKLIHYSHRDLSSMLDKTLVFTGYEAKLRFDIHHPKISWWRIFRVMFSEFWLRFIKLSAWRDGPEGIIDGMFQVYNTFIIYGRLWEMQNESRHL